MPADPGPRIRHVKGALSRASLKDVEVLVVLVVPADDGVRVPPQAGALLGVDLAELATLESARGTAGETTALLLPALTGGDAPWQGLPRRVALVGVGAADATGYRRAGAAIARAGTGRERVVVEVGEHTAGVRALVEGVLLASYRAPFEGKGEGPRPPAGQVLLVGDAALSDVEHAQVAARATNRARTLAATPSSTKNPAWMADRARALAREAGGRRAHLGVTVHDERWIERNGLGGLAAVGRGSVTPPRLVVVDYAPPRATGGPVLLVGKGITYDTGGISIKPREAMVPMKTDMSGAAVVLATVLAAAELGLRQRVVAVLPLAENAFGGASYRPGDVVTVHDGTTVEIGNTDAEGRMVLADGMSWGRATYAPEVLVDVATLTGAASLGLGKQHAALYATEPTLGEELVAAGAAAGEPLWPMPLVDDYRHALDSDVADVSHISTDPHTGGGSITAALFLERFAGEIPWAHLDIAGPGRSSKAVHEISEGATGFSTRALLGWLAAR